MARGTCATCGREKMLHFRAVMARGTCATCGREKMLHFCARNLHCNDCELKVPCEAPPSVPLGFGRD